MRITVSMPCYQRPARTMRSISAIIQQNIGEWEALITGDNCPNIEKIINDKLLCAFPIPGIEYKSRVRIETPGVITLQNLDKNYGHCGYEITNRHIQDATGTYFVFMANDDVILPNHFEHYLSEIEGTDLDFVYFNSLIHPLGTIRNSELRYGSIGHSELIIRTDFLKQMPLHEPRYGHDWDLIRNMITAGAKYKKSTSTLCTYHVMSIPTNPETGID